MPNGSAIAVVRSPHTSLDSRDRVSRAVERNLTHAVTCPLSISSEWDRYTVRSNFEEKMNVDALLMSFADDCHFAVTTSRPVIMHLLIQASNFEKPERAVRRIALVTRLFTGHTRFRLPDDFHLLSIARADENKKSESCLSTPGDEPRCPTPCVARTMNTSLVCRSVDSH